MTVRTRRLVTSGLMTAVMLAILLGLGFWQLRRLKWKQGILAEIASAEAAPAVALPPHPTRFEKVAITGRFHPGMAVFYADEVRALGPAIVQGAYWLAPLFRPGHRPVLVNLGWVPEAWHQPLPAGTITVTGYVDPAGHRGWFAAKDNIAGRHFYTLDPHTIAQALDIGPVAPYTLVALAGPAPSVPPAAPPFAATHLPRPPNNHFQYALTWFGLAGVLAVMFLKFAYDTRREG